MNTCQWEDSLFDLPADKNPLDWATRMKIASGIADGLKYLHEKVDPPVICHDLKSSNILLDEANSPRLSKYGLADLLQASNEMNMSPTVVVDDGYSAPECETNGDITTKSDIYSFGVILLELISGRKAFDSTQPTEEQNLVNWARPIFWDQAKLTDMADPLLKKRFPETSLNQAVGIAAMCLREEPSARPLVSDISGALSLLARAPPEASIPDHLVPMLSTCELSISQFAYSSSFNDCNKQLHMSESDVKVRKDSTSSSDYEYGESSDSSDYEGSIKNPDKSNESEKLSSRLKHGESSDSSDYEGSIKNPDRSNESMKLSSRLKRGENSDSSD